MINNIKVHGKMKVDENEEHVSTYGKFVACEVGGVRLGDLFEFIFKLKGDVVISIDVLNDSTDKVGKGE